MTDKEKALYALLDIDPDFDCISSTNDEEFTYDDQEYLVLTDSEADEKWEEDIESYINYCVLPEIPEDYQSYFDYDGFKRDASYDGRGHALATYDGHEKEQEVDGTTYYIYRIN